VDNRKIVPNNVVTHKVTGILKKLDTLCDRFCSACIVVHKGLLSIEIVDTKTVDLGNIIVKAVSFKVEDEVHLPSSSAAMARSSSTQIQRRSVSL
jgi:hypothetical protein